MSYTVDQLSWAIQRGSLRVSAEIAASLVLSVAEQLRGSPRWVTGAEITLVDAGSVLLSATAPSAPEACDGCLRALLRELIRGSGGEHPAIDAVCNGIPRSPAELADQLRVALIPLNRSAIRRGLARVHRRLAAVGPPEFVRTEGSTPRLDVRSEPAQRSVPAAVAPVTPAGPPVDRTTAPRACDEHTPFLGSMSLDGAPPRASALPGGVRAPAELDTPALYDAFELETSELELFEPETPEPETLVRGLVYEAPPGPTEPAPTVLPREPEPLGALPHIPSIPRIIPRVATPLVAPARTTFERHEAHPSADSPELAFGRFSSRRSQVNTLVEGFSLETPSAVQSLSEALRRCFDAEAEAAVSCTPPPARALNVSGREAGCREPGTLGIGV